MCRARILVGMMAMFALGLFLAAPGAKAGNNVWEMKTTLTFSQPFEIPGDHIQILPAGTYVFRMLNDTYQDMVQISNVDGTHVYALVRTNPTYRVRVGEKTMMTFEEAGAGLPVAVHAWYHPGLKAGEEFSYANE